MMETAQARARNHRRLGRRLLLNWPAIRSVLVEGVVNPIFAIIADVISDQPPKMVFVEAESRGRVSLGDKIPPSVRRRRSAREPARSFALASDPWLSGR